MNRHPDRGNHISPHATVSWEEKPATLADVIHDTPGSRMRQEKERLISSPEVDVDLVAHRVHALMMANAQPRIKDNVVAKRSGLTLDGTPYMIASALRGLTERRPDGTLNPIIEQFHGATFFKEGDGDDAWCASFMNWCLREGGRDDLMTDSPRARSFTELPQFIEGYVGMTEGDIMVFTRGKNPAKGHVAFSTVDGYEVYEYIDVLGGNQNDSVCVKPYASERILGYIPLL